LAVNAKFVADFSSFYSAVDKAEAELRGFETEANKVEKSLNRMANGFSGRQVIQDATLMAKAVKEIGGATALTEKEQLKVNAAMTDAIAKYRVLGAEARKAIGPEVIAQFEAMEKATRKIEPPLSMGAKAMGVLGSAFGQFTAAGLAVTAINKLAGGVAEFAAQGAKLPALQDAFKRLTANIGQDGDVMLANMTKSTKGLVSNFDLIQSSNKAMLLGLPVTSESMGEMAKAATRLGRAMGMDATKSLDDLITALGRSSPMILDNLGLTVKVGEANEAYAAKLGKNAEALTDAEKKMAFYNAAMEAARKKSEELGDKTKTFGEIVTSVWTTVGNVISEKAAKANVDAGRMLEDIGNILSLGPTEAARRARKSIADEEARNKALNDPFAAGVRQIGLDLQKMSADKDALVALEKAARNATAALPPLSEQQARIATGFLRGGESVQFVLAELKKIPATADVTEKQLKKLDDQIKGSGKSSSEYAEASKRIHQVIVPLNDAQRQRVDVWIAEGKATKDMATVLGVTEIAVNDYKKDQDDLNKILEKGIGHVSGLGDGFKTLGEQMKRTDGIVSTLMVNIDHLKDAHPFGIGSSPIQLPMFELPPPPDASAWEEHFLGLSAASAEAARMNGEVWMLSFQKAGMYLGNLGRHFDGVMGDILSMAAETADALSTMFNPMSSSLDKVMAGIDLAISLGQKFVGLFKDEEHEEVNDLRDNFLSQFGTGDFVGFNNLAAQLHALGDAGDAMFNRLINAKKVGEFEAAMSAIETALGKANAAKPENLAAAAGFQTKAQLEAMAAEAVKVHAYMRDSGLFTASAVQEAWERANAALVKAGDEGAIAAGKAEAALAGLKAELKGLEDSVAAEAWEEEMGVIEKEQRARIDAIKAEMEAREAQIQEETAAREDAAQQAADDLKRILSETEFIARLKFEYELPEGLTVGAGGSLPGFAGGTKGQYLDFGKGTLAMLHGKERVVTEAEGRAGSAGGSGTVVIQLDGRTIAQAVVPWFPGEVRRFVRA
jgi:hypothetical protein